MDFELHRFDQLDSSNAECQRRVANGCRGNQWVVAGAQSAGRGRRGREWMSAPGNLFASLLYEIDCDLKTAAQLSFVTALAVRDVVADLLQSNAAVTCKWPNDILVGGRKISGILLETAGQGAPRHVIMGIGINVQSHPTDTIFPATHLGPEFQVDQVLDKLIPSMSRWISIWQDRGFPPIRRTWRENASGLGQEIIVRLTDEELHGKFCDLDKDGALIVEIQGERRHITAGDVFFP